MVNTMRKSIQHVAAKYGVATTLLCCGWASNIGAEPVFATMEDAALNTCINKLMVKNDWATAQDVTSIKCHNKDISSAAGIQQFRNITSLSLYKNAIETFTLSEFEKLEILNLAGNKLDELTIANLPALKKLYAFGNGLTRLHLDATPQLAEVKANNNKLTSVTFSSTPHLTKLNLFDNELDYLEVESLPELRYLDVRQNPMSDEFYDFLDQRDRLTVRHDGNMEDW